LAEQSPPEEVGFAVCQTTGSRIGGEMGKALLVYSDFV
jgi:hypothetical protein